MFLSLRDESCACLLVQNVEQSSQLCNLEPAPNVFMCTQAAAYRLEPHTLDCCVPSLYLSESDATGETLF